MEKFDPHKHGFGPRLQEESILRDYLINVANSPGLLAYKNINQYGAKQGESLYTHILNGIMLLDVLRTPLGLSDRQTRILFTAYTIHDINKDPAYNDQAYARVAMPDNFDELIRRLNLDQFFPQYGNVLSEITRIAGQHGGHSGGLSLVTTPKPDAVEASLDQLLALIRAVDTADLSHTLEERRHKATFLSHLNESNDERQFDLFVHRLAENRGSLSNIIHHAIVATLKEQGLTPLLYYPDGVVYLVDRQHQPHVDERLLARMAEKTAVQINELTAKDIGNFVKSGIQGIKVDPKCLELGIPFEKLWEIINTRVQTRNLKRDELLPKVKERTERNFDKNRESLGEQADENAEAVVSTKLAEPESLIPTGMDRLRLGELIRTYYIFLNTHFKDQMSDAWEHIYDLLEIAPETRAWLAYFDPRWDRPYTLMVEFDGSYDDVYDKIEEDGISLTSALEIEDDKKDLFQDYLMRYALFGYPGSLKVAGGGAFSDHLLQYVANPHKQCVHCSSLLPTDKWMTNDVRSDITVQTFSNRLRGGPGEPKKNICRMCQLQFLVERLNFEEVRGEKTMYLHLFPYSFLPAPYLTAMQESIRHIRREDSAVRALYCDSRSALLDNETGIDPHFATQTKKGKPHPYGIYMPRVAGNTVGNRLIFPINPAGDNDSQRFLYALWLALVMQKHLGLRVLLTEAPVAPLVPDVDLLLDNVALSCRGLVERNDYRRYETEDGSTDGALVALRQQARSLHKIADSIRTTSKLDEVLALVLAMSGGPLAVYHTAEKLLEARVRGESGGSSEWQAIRLSQQIFDDVQALTESKGGSSMTELSRHMQELAEIAWAGGLRGKSLKKNSLIMPLNQVFEKLNQRSPAFDDEALKAATIEDIFEYLDRIADEKYKPGKRKMAAATDFVDRFYENIYYGDYQDNLTKLLADEKALRSTYMFYIRQQIGAKSEGEEDV